MLTTRKRNVTSRKRSGCVTCRARRLKCDEGTPDCSNCTRLRLKCGGYATQFRFKDQTSLLKRKHEKPRSKSPAKTTPAEVPEPSADWVVSVSPSPPANDLPCASPAADVENGPEHRPTIEAQPRSILYDAATPPSPTSAISPSHVIPITLHNRPTDFGIPSFALQEGFSLPSTPDVFGHPSVESAPVEQPRVGDVPIQSTKSPVSPFTQDGTESCSPSAIGWRPKPFSIAPSGLLEAAKFAEDMIYYHHLCDTSPSGLLSILDLHEIFQVDCLDKGFFHAALALSAFHVSQSPVHSKLARAAAIHALDHFVEALGSTRDVNPSDDVLDIQIPSSRQNNVTWLATLLLLANFELSRGQMKLWYVHSHAAVTYLSQSVSQVSKIPVGESIIRCFSRIASLLEIFDRSYTAHHGLALSSVSMLLGNSLKLSPNPQDRLLVILPRVIEFEEESRSTPGLDHHWRLQAQALVNELKDWRRSLDSSDVPTIDELQADSWMVDQDGTSLTLRPLLLSRSSEPVKAATNFMHYLVSLVRLETEYLPGAGRQLPANANRLILAVCRLSAGVSSSSCSAINAYGHGMVPAMMNAYYLSEDEAAKRWIKAWISRFPYEREGIWNVQHARRLLQYVDHEYSRRGSRKNWEIIKVRMVDLEEEGISEDSQKDPDRFSVEIYSRCRRGWSIDFVDIP